MTPAERLARLVIAALLGAFALYGLTALPDLVARWGVTPASLVAVALWIGLAATGIAVLRKRPGKAAFAVLVTLLLVARIGVAFVSTGRVSPGDSHSYLLLAHGLIAGRGLAIYEPYFGSEWRALFPPAYPVLLAAWGAIAGFSTASLLALATATDLTTAVLITRLAERLGGASGASGTANPGAVGRRAAWLYLIWPSALFSAPLAQKESLCALLVVALALAWLTPRPGWRGAVALGVPAGLLALTQPGEAPLAALFAIVLLGRSTLARVLLTGLPGAIVAMLVLLPWWLRNWAVFHAFVPLTSASGPSLWIGNNPAATGNWEPPPVALKGLPELTYDARIKALAVAWIAQHPFAFVHLTVAKLLRAGGIGVFGVVRLTAMQPRLPIALAAAAWPVAHGAHVVLYGGVAILQRGVPRVLMLLIVACAVQWVVFGMWFEFGERHREFATPFLLLALCQAIGMPAVEKRAAKP